MSTFIDENELDLTTTTKSDLSSSLQPNSFSPSTISSNTIITIPDKYVTNERSENIIAFRNHRSHSVVVEKPVKKVRLSEEINREKKYDDAAFDQYDLQRQIRASIVSLPADVQFPQSIEVSQKRPWFLSKLLLSFHMIISVIFNHLAFHSSSFSNWKKSNDSPVHSLKLFEIYKYADRFDIILMVIGTIAGKIIQYFFVGFFLSCFLALGVGGKSHRSSRRIQVASFSLLSYSVLFISTITG